MHKRFEFLEFSKIRHLWESSSNPIGVYIHSPFCPSICKFCIYAGNLLIKNSDYSDYYENYLPKVIKLYHPILEEKNESIQNWFFGGGTPSMMKPETLKNVLELLPNFKSSKATKTFEIHPAYWSDELLDVLKEYNFDNIIICLQTFDRKTLIKQKRVPETKEKIIELSEKLHNYKFNVLVDIISYLNNDENDLSILISDLQLVFEKIKPHEISIQTLYQKKEFTSKTLYEVINCVDVLNGNYLIEFMDSNSITYLPINKIKISQLLQLNTTLKCFRLVHKDTKDIHHMMRFVRFMDPQYKTGVNCDSISMGSFKNTQTQTHSNISNFNYYEVNNNNNDPQFKFVFNSFYDEVRTILNMLEKYGEPPKGFELYFKNSFFEKNEIPLMLDFKFKNHYLEISKKMQNEIDKENERLYNTFK